MPTPRRSRFNIRPPLNRHTFFRWARLHLFRARGIKRGVAERLTLFSGWTWVAAGSLVGFEMLEIIFGGFILAPELLPLAILTLAILWLFRERIQTLRKRAYVRRRARRARRQR